MKKIIASGLGALLFAAPACALADSGLTPTQAQILQLTAVVAALEAQEAALSSGQALACAALASKASVRVGQAFALAWGSVGTISSAATTTPTWSPNGASMVALQAPGTWSYSFTFYGASGASATCTAKIIVTS